MEPITMTTSRGTIMLPTIWGVAEARLVKMERVMIGITMPVALALSLIHISGIPALLEELRGAGVTTAVVSNKPHANTVDLAARFFPGLPAFGQREGIPAKPAPDMVWAALEELGAPREGALYVGDSEVDVETARRLSLIHI